MADSDFIPRHIRQTVLDSLAESRATAILGPRQVGKSTLAKELAASAHPARYLTLDDEPTARAAREDPVSLLAELDGPAVIDEVQRAPNLLLAIKMKLDNDNTPGQFLLTGSANILTLPTIADTLPGRVEYVRLWPLSQCELHGTRATFIDGLFEGSTPKLTDVEVGRPPLAPMLVRGGYPEMARRSTGRRTALLDSYVDSLIQRDVREIADVRDPATFRRVLQLLAVRSSGLLNVNGMASELGIDRGTVNRHIQILEDLFIVRRLGAWHRNLGNRIVKSPKAYVVDSGLLAHLVGADEERVARDGGIAGALLESFVAMELVRMAQLTTKPVTLQHFRDRRQREVDIVIERYDGDVVGVEVKATATPRASDFAGLRYLRDALGPQFKQGVLLHTGSQTLPFGDRLAAVPVSGLWSGPAAD